MCVFSQVTGFVSVADPDIVPPGGEGEHGGGGYRPPGRYQHAILYQPGAVKARVSEKTDASGGAQEQKRRYQNILRGGPLKLKSAHLQDGASHTASRTWDSDCEFPQTKSGQMKDNYPHKAK
jgi:hypothetical protein